MSDIDDKELDGDNVDQDAMADEWAAAMAEQEVSDASAGGAESINLDEFSKPDDAGPALATDIDVILDIPVTISMQVGSTSISIRNLLQLNQGSVIELDRLAGEPLDVLVNGTLIAHGEVVVVNEKFGIRMTDVISPSERIKRLR
ncbi:flagellar motor switch protein FliN [Halioxenophilus sp. WMMB6]|uniref:flagellar motor switch protein FliN n=1 Tax=Halioxenophilus sp. WMMB6 TaxID=3073815 RepID=UPI00295E70A8|nr:flagellar motor switch protein FliN [Halioxenophilus sp. WMMB6]